MAYVVPSGTIQLMRGVRLDNRYAHTIYFADTTAQYNWFTNKVAYTYNNQYYTRQNANTIRLKVPCDTVADCTYLRFQNRPNGKWYYAFINYVNYINENVTEIIFEIDVMQTWFFQTGHDLKPCYVDREHVSADTFGVYHAPDSPRTEEYVYRKIADTSSEDYPNGLFNQMALIWVTTEEPDPDFIYNNNSFTGCRYHIDSNEANNSDPSYAAGTIALIKTGLGGSWDKNVQSADMVDFYAFPYAFCDSDVANNVHQVAFAMPTTFTYSDNSTYTPKNKKLLSSPYCMLYATDFKGESSMYLWENFIDPTMINFTLRGNMLAGGSIIVYPNSYAGLQNAFDAGFLINDFPKRSFNYDAYEAWVAGGGLTRWQNKSDLVGLQGIARISETVGDVFGIVKQGANTSMAIGAAAATGGVATPLAVREAAGLTQDIANTVGKGINRYVEQKEAQNNLAYEFNDAKYAPNIVMGQDTPDIVTSHRILDVNFMAFFPRKDEAIRIDDFFSTYGYSIKEVKTPVMTGRKHWNFLKTKGCVVGGNMPSSSRQAICDIIDGGIFFWKDGDELGNFRVEVTNGSINNPILT